jgi:hypothetical protein
VNLASSQVHGPDYPAPLPLVPSSLPEVVGLLAEAVDRPSAEVAEVLRVAMPRRRTATPCCG